MTDHDDAPSAAPPVAAPPVAATPVAAPILPARASSSAADIDPRRLLVSTALALLALVLVVGAVGLWLRGPLLTVGGAFVARFGGPGVAVGFAIPDAFTVPLPNDTFLALGLAGGMSDAALIGWGTFGSIMGGSLAWLLGRLLRRTAWLQRFLAGPRGAGLSRAFRNHAVKIVAIAAVTPLPYSVSAWAAGSTLMPYRTFVAVSGLRVVRVVMSLYLIHLGLAATS